MAKANPSAEPSMEEILASIRRIISDDGDAPAKAPAPAPRPATAAAAAGPEPAGEPAEGHVTEDDLDRLFASAGSDDADDLDAEEDVLELDEEMTAAEEDPVELVEGLMPDEAEVAFADVAAPAPWPEPAVEERAAAPPPPEPPPAPRAPGPGPAASRAEPEEEPLVSAHTGASVNAAFGQLTHTILSANARTLDDLVKEMLRPMLKAWLDENLPSVVERLVRAEIERVSRGR